MKREVPDGLHVRYEHKRMVDNVNFKKVIQPRGGVTIAFVEDEHNEPKAVGAARCSNQDQYNKKVGRKIALERALYNLENDG